MPQTQLTEFLKCGGFELRKWSSNHPSLLENLQPEQRETQLPLQIDMDNSVKTLGIQWHPAKDIFTSFFYFSVQPNNNNKTVTKRVLLSDFAKLFDPLGRLAPTIVLAKVMFQKFWLLGISWDEALPLNFMEQWLSFRNDLQQLDKIQIHRCVVNSSTVTNYQLHGFCDSSETAYAAVIYLRTECESGDVAVHLLCSKTKVAPIKQISLPRLELCGATLLARLMDAVNSSLLLSGNEVHAWTDSTVVLSWLIGHPNPWKTYVGNRASEIQDLIPPKHWKHVTSGDNPADCASRGVSPSQLATHPLWWHGPKWLQADSSAWISLPQPTENSVAQLEQKSEKLPGYCKTRI